MMVVLVMMAMTTRLLTNLNVVMVMMAMTTTIMMHVVAMRVVLALLLLPLQLRRLHPFGLLSLELRCKEP